MVQKQYQTELTNVQQNVLRLGELANSAIKDSVEALQDHNVEQAEAGLMKRRSSSPLY